MITDLWLIGMGTGSPDHLTGEGLRALREVEVILLPEKGEDKGDLADLRLRLIETSGTRAKIVRFAYPRRDPALPYLTRVARWHDEIAARWQAALADAPPEGPVALLVWGDPSLYDSTMRIAERLMPRPALRVIPGITAIQALTAAHGIPLNSVGAPVTITTGRQLRDKGWPEGANTVVVMLDGEASFTGLDPDLTIWWGAFLGMTEQVLDHGRLGDVAARIVATRDAERARHGWIMDTYLLRRSAG